MDDQLSMFSIVNTAMAVRSMRDSGYKSTTHALAELVDNAIEANATEIEIFGVNRWDNHTNRWTLKELAVLDNGVGMDPTTLRRSLRYGDGTRVAAKGIGRFGLGLPNSSMSQARQVDVWSWQSGATNALHTWLAIAAVEGGALEIPVPIHRPLPAVYSEAKQQRFGDSGTLVVWSELDRVEWKRASTTFKHAEALIGRIYRRFLALESHRLHADDSRSSDIGPRRYITCVPVDVAEDEVTVGEIIRVRPNDPLYLMTNTSCPERFGRGPMFEEIDASPFCIPVVYRDREHQIRVRASHARRHARDSDAPDAMWPEQFRGNDAGNTPWGKHAAKNMGISLVRAHRELEIDQSWLINYDPVERWWKIEIDFPPALDDLFGVTNNKQGAVTFQRLAQFDLRREADPGESSKDVRRRMKEEGDPRVHLLDLHGQIEKTVSFLRGRVKAYARVRGTRRVISEDEKANAKATAKIKKRNRDGHSSETERLAEDVPTDKQDAMQVDSLANHGMSRKDALMQIDETMKRGHCVRWIHVAKQAPVFFDVELLPGILQIALNINHPVYEHLYEVMHPDIDDMDETELRTRLAKSAAAFRILLYAWGRYEDEQLDGERRKVRNARYEWGKYAEDFFVEDEYHNEEQATSSDDD